MSEKIYKYNYVSFETAKALKDAGYPQIWNERAYDPDGDLHACLYETDEESACTAPHLWDAMEWLREEKKLFVEIRINKACKYFYNICDLCNADNDIHSSERFPTYEQACDQGIKAACEWLISQEVATKR